jgi:26S proteasome regulatory subunit (ATPase 3-interacting protein)
MGKKKASSENSAPSSSSTLDKEEQIIYNYLTKQNRPYSAVDVFNNLHGAVGKTACVRVLTSLAEKGQIHQKTYGKQSVFVARQDIDSAATPEELAALDDQIAEAKKSLGVKNERVAELQGQLNNILATPTNEKLDDLIARVKSEISEKQVRLDKLSAGGQLVDPQERIKVLKEAESLSKLLKSRRRMCMDLVNGVLDGAGDAIGRKSAKEFMQEMGCDVD